jgi:hypothetical protein
MLLQRGNKNFYTITSSSFDLALFQCILGTQSAPQMTEGLFGWTVAVKKVAVGCELWKKLLYAVSC